MRLAVGPRIFPNSLSSSMMIDDGSMVTWIKRLERQSRAFFVFTALVIVIAIGFVDYVTGWELSFSAFYLLALGLAVWFVGKQFAWFLSALSVAVSLAGD